MKGEAAMRVIAFNLWSGTQQYRTFSSRGLCSREKLLRQKKWDIALFFHPDEPIVVKCTASSISGYSDQINFFTTVQSALARLL